MPDLENNSNRERQRKSRPETKTPFVKNDTAHSRILIVCDKTSKYAEQADELLTQWIERDCLIARTHQNSPETLTMLYEWADVIFDPCDVVPAPYHYKRP